MGLRAGGDKSFDRLEKKILLVFFLSVDEEDHYEFMIKI